MKQSIFIFILIMILCSSANAWRIPDSGQQMSLTTVSGEDSDYTINHSHYIKLDETGQALSDSATQWVMVHDEITGLTWEVKTNDLSIHNYGITYIWSKLSEFIDTLNVDEFGGYSDWRIPDIAELSSLLKLTPNNHMDQQFFPHYNPSLYWTSVLSQLSPNYMAWAVNFENANIESLFKTSPYHVRAVRGKPMEVTHHTFINNDQTVTDTRTGLTWLRQVPQTLLNWTSAISWCESLTYANHTDWRLPQKETMRSLIDYSRTEPSVDTTIFFDMMPGIFWTSSADEDVQNQVWTYNLQTGNNELTLQSQTASFLAVRGGQSIRDGMITITSPVQASHWNFGDVIPIKWKTDNYSGNVLLTLSRQGGKPLSYETIVLSTANDGEYDWTVTGPHSINCVLNITSIERPSEKGQMGMFYINDIESGLIAHYSFNQSFFDVSSNLNHSENHHTNFVQDKMGNTQYACLMSPSSYLDLKKICNNISHNSLSFSIWLNPQNAEDNSEQILFSLYHDSGTDENRILLKAKSLIFQLNHQGSIKSVFSDPWISSNHWRHIVITVNDDIVSIFVNAILVTQMRIPELSNFYKQTFTHCTAGSSDGSSYSGVIDDFRLYNHVLTKNEINALLTYKELQVSGTYRYLPSTSGSDSITIVNTGSDNIFWTAASESSWITIIDGGNGLNKGVLTFYYDKNMGPQRIGTIIILAENTRNSPLEIQVTQQDYEIQIPRDFPDIDTAIILASEGSIIRVADGNYTLSNPIDKSISLISDKGHQNCFITGSLTINNSNFIINGFTIENISDNGLNIQNSVGKIVNCIIRNNNANGISSLDSKLLLSNLVITGNSISGINANHSELTIVHTTIAGNVTDGLNLIDAQVNMTNSILWNNALVNSNSSLDIQFSDIQGGFSGTGNINTDPMFLNPLSNQYELKDDSPCLDIGTMNDLIPAEDIIEQPRPKPAGSNPDIGAYENVMGKKDMYVFFPPDAQTYCPEEDTSITIVWDASLEKPFYRFSVFKDFLKGEFLTYQDWNAHSYIFLSLDMFDPGHTYYWQVDPLPVDAESSTLTGYFHIKPTCEDRFKASDPGFFLLGFVIAPTSLNLKQVHIDDLKCSITQFPGVGIFGSIILSDSNEKRNVFFPGKNLPAKRIKCKPYGYSQLLYWHHLGWFSW